MGTRRTTCTVCGDAPCYAFLSIQLWLFQSAYSSFLQGNCVCDFRARQKASFVAAWWIQHVRRLAKHRPPATLASDEFFMVYTLAVSCDVHRESGQIDFACRLHEKRPLAGAFGVVIIRSGSGDFFDGRFQQGDTLFDAVDFQIFFVAVEAGTDRAKAVQRRNAVGRGDVGV